MNSYIVFIAIIALAVCAAGRANVPEPEPFAPEAEGRPAGAQPQFPCRAQDPEQCAAQVRTQCAIDQNNAKQYRDCLRLGVQLCTSDEPPKNLPRDYMCSNKVRNGRMQREHRNSPVKQAPREWFMKCGRACGGVTSRWFACRNVCYKQFENRFCKCTTEELRGRPLNAVAPAPEPAPKPAPEPMPEPMPEPAPEQEPAGIAPQYPCQKQSAEACGQQMIRECAVDKKNAKQYRDCLRMGTLLCTSDEPPKNLPQDYMCSNKVRNGRMQREHRNSPVKQAPRGWFMKCGRACGGVTSRWFACRNVCYKAFSNRFCSKECAAEDEARARALAETRRAAEEVAKQKAEEERRAKETARKRAAEEEAARIAEEEAKAAAKAAAEKAAAEKVAAKKAAEEKAAEEARQRALAAKKAEEEALAAKRRADKEAAEKAAAAKAAKEAEERAREAEEKAKKEAAVAKKAAEAEPAPVDFPCAPKDPESCAEDARRECAIDRKNARQYRDCLRMATLLCSLPAAPKSMPRDYMCSNKVRNGRMQREHRNSPIKQAPRGWFMKCGRACGGVTSRWFACRNVCYKAFSERFCKCDEPKAAPKPEVMPAPKLAPEPVPEPAPVVAEPVPEPAPVVAKYPCEKQSLEECSAQAAAECKIDIRNARQYRDCVRMGVELCTSDSPPKSLPRDYMCSEAVREGRQRREHRRSPIRSAPRGWFMKCGRACGGVTSRWFACRNVCYKAFSERFCPKKCIVPQVIDEVPVPEPAPKVIAEVVKEVEKVEKKEPAKEPVKIVEEVVKALIKKEPEKTVKEIVKEVVKVVKIEKPKAVLPVKVIVADVKEAVIEKAVVKEEKIARKCDKRVCLASLKAEVAECKARIQAILRPKKKKCPAGVKKLAKEVLQLTEEVDKLHKKLMKKEEEKKPVPR